MTVPFFSGADVERAVSPHEAYDAVRDAFVAHAKGDWTMQPKLYVTNYPAGDFRAMPALGGGHALLKWVTSFPGNPAQGLPTVTGLVLLSDAETGALVALLDAAAVTALRTAAAGVIAAETLCRSGAESTAVIGCGVNGAETVRMFRALGGDVQVWDLDPARSALVADRLGATVAASQAGCTRVRHRRHGDTRARAALPRGVAARRTARLDDGSGRPRQGGGGGRGARARRPLLRRLGAGKSRWRAGGRSRGGRRDARHG